MPPRRLAALGVVRKGPWEMERGKAECPSSAEAPPRGPPRAARRAARPSHGRRDHQ